MFSGLFLVQRVYNPKTHSAFMPNRKNFSVKVKAKVTVFGIKAAVLHFSFYTNGKINTLTYYTTKAKRLQ